MKIFYTIFLFFLLFSSTFASEDIKIITRAEWGADENIRYIDSVEWKEILQNWEQQKIKDKDKILTQAQIDAQNKAKEKNKLILDILDKYSFQRGINSRITTENSRKLFWPIEKAEKITGIIIHHTSTDYASSIEGVRNIYRYHTLKNAWGDIGYNFIIGNDGEIYEGRAGGETSVAAHAKYNNIGNIGISIIGNYSDKAINDKQYLSLKNLTSYLVNKYDIDLNKKKYYHSDCNGKSCDLPLNTVLSDTIIGHRDAGNTSCPGDKLYAQIQDIKSELKNKNTPIFSIKNDYNNKINKLLEKIPENKLLDILANIENDLDKKVDLKKMKAKGLIVNYFKSKSSKNLTSNIKVNQKISIKLSYPDNDIIKIKSGNIVIELKRDGKSLLLAGKKFSSLKIPKKDPNSILEIVSWNRVPEWDKEKKYNDNKFRGDLIISVKDNKLLVVNKLNMEDYLKGLGEVSDYEDSEKVKTIIIAARSYATWYITKDRKFPGESYDGVDDPNVFQKYLGYSLESRSPNINKIVDQTRGKLITYNGELIKPWYFSNSNGKTLSYYDFCMEKYTEKICKKEAKKYPYLTSVIDKGSEGKQFLGHGVGISGAGVKYFAEKGWSYDLIIKYYLKGVEVG
ncbi:MAG: N-acetylmuramoyl-L-alanine amidase [Candidatus Gracilibacteria bacterium]|nr:N-acetylmuramoyl-L-alanine amidase [Candidatus Gracilibacteria bacterium]